MHSPLKISALHLDNLQPECYPCRRTKDTVERGVLLYLPPTSEQFSVVWASGLFCDAGMLSYNCHRLVQHITTETTERFTDMCCERV